MTYNIPVMKVEVRVQCGRWVRWRTLYQCSGPGLVFRLTHRGQMTYNIPVMSYEGEVRVQTNAYT